MLGKDAIFPAKWRENITWPRKPHHLWSARRRSCFSFFYARPPSDDRQRAHDDTTPAIHPWPQQNDGNVERIAQQQNKGLERTPPLRERKNPLDLIS